MVAESFKRAVIALAILIVGMAVAVMPRESVFDRKINALGGPIAAFQSASAQVLGYAESTTQYTGILAQTDIGLSATVTVLADRLIRVTAFVHYNTLGGAETVQIRIKEDGVTKQLGSDSRLTTTAYGTMAITVIRTPSQGTHTYTVTAAAGTLTNAITVDASSSDPNYLLVEDIGASE